MKKITLLLVVAIVLANSFFASANFTANLLFAAKLTGDQETPVVSTSGYGVATFILNATRDTLCIAVTLRDVSSQITAIQIHQGNYGATGPLIFDLTPYINGNRINATLTNGMINPQIVGTLIARQFYINVQTTSYVDGEIRGQLELETDFHLKAYMSGAEVVPPTTSPAIGVASFDLHKDYMYLDLKAQVTGLSGPITTAQLHYGAPGINGPEVSWLDTFVNGNTIICEIPDTLFIYDLLAGNIYININTAANPIGEVRGQIYLQSDLSFDVWMDGSQEVPPTPSPSSACGSMHFSPALDTLFYDVVFDSLLAAPTVAHFHDGIPGVSGPPIVDVSSSINGNHLSGMATSLPPDFIAKCLLGSIYLNVHSSAFPSGEIRGQIHRFAYEGFTFGIDAAQETPPNGSLATGSGFVSIDPEQRSAHYRMVVNDLTGPLTEAHFNNAAPGVSGPPVYDLTPHFTAGATNISASNYWTGIDFSVPFNATYSTMFMNNEMYVNFQTAANPAGEVRGNIMQGGECFITTGIPGTAAIADGWTIYPVPAMNTITLMLEGMKTTQAKIEITDVSGRLVLTHAARISAGENKIDLDVSSLTGGVYGIRLITEGNLSAVGKLVKQ